MWNGICGSLVRELFAVLWKAVLLTVWKAKKKTSFQIKTLTLLESVITSFDIKKKKKKKVSGQIS